MPNTPPRYHRDYANAVSDIYQNMGRAQAEARLQQGGIWANAFGQIGQTVSAIPGQLQAQKDAEAQRQRMAQQDARLAKADQLEESKRADQMLLRNVFASSMGPDGRVDLTRLQENLQKAGGAHIALEATQAWQQMEAGWLAIENAATQRTVNQATLGKLFDDYVGPAAVQWQAAETELEKENILEVALLNLETKGLTEQAAAFRALDPERKQTMMTGYAQRYSPKPSFTTVSQGSTVFNETTGQPVFTNPKPVDAPPVGSFEDYVTSLHGPRPTPAQIASARRSYGEAGRAPSVTVNMPEAVMPPSDVNSQDIMSQAGLSRNGFLALTNPTMLPRDQATRNNASKEVEAWARAKGIDVSTFQSRYASYNKVLTNNTMRLDTVQNIEQDLLGTIQNLQTAANEAGMSDVTAANAVKLWLNNNLNDPKAINYAANLQALVSDIARYNAASSSPDGDRQPLESDMAAARNLLKQGISAGGLDGLLKAVQANVANMDRVNKAAVDRSQKAVWTLFGVGDKYKPTAGSANLIFDPATKTFKKGGL